MTNTGQKHDKGHLQLQFQCDKREHYNSVTMFYLFFFNFFVSEHIMDKGLIYFISMSNNYTSMRTI